MFPSSYLSHKTNPDCGEKRAPEHWRLTPGLPQLPFDFASPLQDWHLDAATDAAPSPDSPMFPEANTYQLPNGSEWLKSGASEANETQSPSMDPSWAFVPHHELGSPAQHPFELSMISQPAGFFKPENLEGFAPILDGAESVPHPRPAKCRKTSGTAPTGRHRNSSPSSKLEPQLAYRKRKSPSPTSASVSPQGYASSSSQAGTPRLSSKGGFKKTSHNEIEKRYRTNLNVKINVFPTIVPTLRVAQYRLEQGLNAEISAEDLDEETRIALDGLVPPAKLNKATILAKTAEYITHMEERIKQLSDEVESLKARSTTRTWG